MVILAALQIPAPLVTMRVLNAVTSPRPTVVMVPLLLELLVVLFVLRILVTAVQRIVMENLRINIVVVIQNLLLEALIQLPLSYHLRHSHGELLSRLEQDPHQIDSLLSDTVLTSVSDMLTLLVGIGLLFYINWHMAAFAIVSVPISAICILKLRRGMKESVRRLQDKIAAMSAFLAEILGNVVSVKTLALESWIRRRYGAKMRSITEQRLSILRMRITYESLVACCSGLPPILLLWYAAYGIAHRSLSVGEFVAFSGYLAYLYRPADSLIISFLNAQGAVNAAERVTFLLETPREDASFVASPLYLSDCDMISVCLNNVFFRYDPTNDWILRDVSCQFASGEITAIMGPSGTGKTSLVNLIPQLMQPNAGTVSVTGIAYNSLTELRSHISLVSCDTLMFSGSVQENIAIGNEGVSQLDINHAAQTACIDKSWLADGPHGAAAGSEGGRSLSAGQRQRVLIARAILRRPKILILDEGTSCLDLDTERCVIENLRGLRIPVIIIVSHRRSIQELADKVYYISQGALNTMENYQEQTGALVNIL